jgi:hypothetical protein
VTPQGTPSLQLCTLVDGSVLWLKYEEASAKSDPAHRSADTAADWLAGGAAVGVGLPVFGLAGGGRGRVSGAEVWERGKSKAAACGVGRRG